MFTNLLKKKFPSFLCTFLFISCSEEPSIQTYFIPPEYDGAIVTWNLPDTWGENPDLTGPMAGSFHVKTKSGKKGRIGVMPFRETVSTIDVANMFGREMGYPSFTKENLASILQEKKIGNRTFEWLYLNSQNDSGSSPRRTALLALLRQEGDTWLFPFIADQKLVMQESDNFIRFLDSCTLIPEKNKPILAKSPPLPSKPRTQTAPPPKNNPWTWTIPDSWTKGKPSSMRIASFKVEDQNEGELDISVTSFPGDVGGLLANVNRWIGQIDLPPVNQSSINQYCNDRKLAGTAGHLVEAYGKEKAVLAGILFLESESWFFKLIGDRQLAEKEKTHFIDFIDSVVLKAEAKKK